MWLFLLFVSVPLIEIALFIKVGGLIGLWPTLAIVVITAFIGTLLMRTQGANALMRLRQSMERLEDPSEPLADGAMIIFAGALLLTPGFFTDAIGLLLLLPPVRRAVFRYVKARVHVQSFTVSSGPGPEPRESDDVIDADYEEIPPSRRGIGHGGRH